LARPCFFSDVLLFVERDDSAILARPADRIRPFLRTLQRQPHAV
jgi:hypothetical protein